MPALFLSASGEAVTTIKLATFYVHISIYISHVPDTHAISLAPSVWSSYSYVTILE